MSDSTLAPDGAHPATTATGTATTTGAASTTGTVSAPGSPARTGLALTVILTCQLMVVLDSAVVTIALPDVQKALSFSATGLSWVQNAYMLAFGGLLLLGGRLGDVLGRRRIFGYGVALFTLASLVGGLADGSGLLLAARAVQGLAAAVAAPSTLALIITTYTDDAKRARAIALYSTVTGAGAAIGMILGGVLTSGLSWRWDFFVNVPFGLAVVVLAPRVIKEPARVRTPLDVPGALTVTAGAVALVYAFIRAASHGWSDGTTVGLLVAAVLLLGAFVAVEARTAHPLVPLRLLADRTRGGSYLALLLVAAAMFGMFYFVTQYLQTALGYSALRTGFAFLPFAVAMFAGATAVPRIMARLGATGVLVAGSLLVGGGLLWLTPIGLHTGYLSGVFGPMVVFGVGGGFVFVPLSMGILGGVPPEYAGAASGLLQAMQQIGGAVGTAVLVTCYSGAVRHPGGRPAADPVTEAHRALTHGVGVAMAVAALFVLVALVLIAALIRLPRAGAGAGAGG
ncbi:MFS transporter [Kitasatospora viridis]|uniref:EmrB/QacA subfamily drug resistance transporter n=1 Tax=Kitasatospora viridis TaxID=281105 RepID=A0A561TT79_9ACTN|nr:MFS transporter [Kitasatospora viridis]TWF90287.1 EmrB/QacA subfamily drug resistance transporter [Kitasatospora viridis]